MTTLDGKRPARAAMALRELWRAYDQLVAAGRECACGAGCSVCCSDRVLLTTLEARLLVEELQRLDRGDLLVQARQASAPAGPAHTFNALARLCLAGQEPCEAPETPMAPGTCPLLQDGLCAAYLARPLACRVMASQEPCRPGGCARQESWWVSVDTVFLQIAEQLDAGGGFGPLPRVLAGLDDPRGAGLLVCENLPGLPVPPKDQERLSRLLMQVFSRPLEGLPLGQWINQLRV